MHAALARRKSHQHTHRAICELHNHTTVKLLVNENNFSIWKRACMCVYGYKEEWKLMQKAAGINYSNSLRAVAACRLALVSSLRARAFARFFHFFRRRSLLLFSGGFLWASCARRLELVSCIFLHRKSAKPCVSLDLYAPNAAEMELTFCSLMTHWAAHVAASFLI